MESKEFNELNKLVRKAKQFPKRGQHYRKLSERWGDLMGVNYSDAGWASRLSGHSQAGGLLFLAPLEVLKGCSGGAGSAGGAALLRWGRRGRRAVSRWPVGRSTPEAAKTVVEAPPISASRSR